MGKFTTIIISFGILTTLATSCKMDTGNATDVFTKVYSAENLVAQKFTIDAGIDNVITGKKGTKIRILKNTLVDSTGNLATGAVEIQLKEAFTTQDMVLGNLTTTYNGQPLETGGMLFIDAKSGNTKLAIANGKTIDVAMPAQDGKLQNMSIFEGKQDSIEIKWANPVAIIVNKPFQKLDTNVKVGKDTFHYVTNAGYSVDGFDMTDMNSINKIPKNVSHKISEIFWAKDTLIIKKDSVFYIDGYKVTFIKTERLSDNIAVADKWFSTNNFEQGTNTFAVDENANYVFNIKKLGWANIDRLAADPRTREVVLTTTIENKNDFKNIYVTLITQKMYLPGYQRKDGTFCFSHGDNEPQRLPVGETATIMATAYKGDKPYFGFKKITITDKQSLSFKLDETTMEQLKKDLLEKI